MQWEKSSPSPRRVHVGSRSTAETWKLMENMSRGWLHRTHCSEGRNWEKKTHVYIYGQRAMQTGERGAEMGARLNPLPLVIWKASKVVQCSQVKSRQTFSKM